MQHTHVFSVTEAVQEPVYVTASRWYEKIIAIALVASVMLTPFGWVFAAEETGESAPAPEPVEAVEPTPEPAPQPEPVEAQPVEEPAPAEEEPSAPDTTSEQPSEEVVSEEVTETETPQTEPDEGAEEDVTSAEEKDVTEESQEATSVDTTPASSASSGASTTPTVASTTTSTSTSETTTTATSTPQATTTPQQSPSGGGGGSVASTTATTTSSVATSTATTTASHTENDTAASGGGAAQSSTTSTTTATTTQETTNTEETADEQEETAAVPVDEGIESTMMQGFFEDDSRYVFSAADCVMVRDGEFFCMQAADTNKDAATSTAEQSSPNDDTSDSLVFARKDAEGDREIYLNYNDQIIQITYNSVDDDAPVYDAESNTVVWHALVKERYQIFAYNVALGSTQQITNTNYNNTDPYIHSGRIVWQGWAGEDWEIFTISDVTASPEQITDNNYPDMFPKVYRNFVTWQARIGAQWQSYLYDVNTGSISRIGEAGESGFESPRFVLMVERRTANGDIEKIGYDVGTGEEIQLGVTPKQLPVEPTIPEDPTKDQKSIMPSTVQSSTTPKTSTDDDEGDVDE